MPQSVDNEKGDDQQLTRASSSRKKEDGTRSGDSEVSALPIVEQEPQNSRHVKGVRLVVVLLAFMLASSLMALDQTIIATALPSIASDFNAVSQLAWIASGYFLSQAGLMLLYGKILAIAPSKIVMLVAIAIFEGGSLICAVANSIQLLIFGRVFAGVGSAGIWVSVLTTLAEITPLQHRPAYLGSFGAVFAISSVVGPLLGGVFSQRLTWRWCFWINLPLGAFAAFIVLLFLPNLRNDTSVDAAAPRSRWSKWISLDWVGSALSIALTVTFLLPLQWGGTQKPWNDPAVIALFCVAFLLTVAFVLWEKWQGDNALLPMNMFLRRTQIGACVSSFFLYICFVIGTYFLPFYYQVKGHSASRSGIDILPYMLSGVISSAVAGVVANITHHYWSFIAIPPLLASVGAGLLFSVDASTPAPKLIGFQILFGTGIGAALQNTILAVQAEYAAQPERVSQATSMCSFAQLIGLSVGIAIGGAVLDNEFSKELARNAPDLPAEVVQAVKQSVEVVFTLPEAFRAEVVAAYTASVSRVFLVAVPCAVLASASALLIKNHKLGSA